MQQVSVYLTSDEWVLASLSRTVQGVWVANLRIGRLARSSSDDALGEQIRSSLGESQLGVSHPHNWTEFHRQFGAALGVANLRRFEREHPMISVRFDRIQLILTPQRYMEPKGGYDPLPGRVCLDDLTPPKVGEALRLCSTRFA